jgi:hypothetical protein
MHEDLKGLSTAVPIKPVIEGDGSDQFIVCRGEMPFRANASIRHRILTFIFNESRQFTF